MDQRRRDARPGPESPAEDCTTPTDLPAGESAPAARTEVGERRARIEALIELLADDSPAVSAAVRARLEACGRPALPALRRAARSPQARKRARARSLVADMERTRMLRRVLGFGAQRNVDLERGLFLLSGFERSHFDSRPYVKALDAMGAEVRERVAQTADGFAAPMALTQYLGNELGFVGCETDFNHPDNIHVHRAIERKRGMPLTLVAIYLLVARRAGLRAAPIALPGRVLLRLYAGPRSLILDPFLGGRVRTRADCVRYLAQHGLVPRPQWFTDASDAALFQRHLLNLLASCQARGLTREARELQQLVSALNRARAARRRAESSPG